MSPMQLFVPLFFLGTLIKSKSRKAGAVYDIIWSVGILIWAIGVMNDGGRIALFGSLELPPYAVIGLLALIIISEVGALIGAIKGEPAELAAAKQQEEEKKAEVARIEAEGEKLDTPAKLYIVHKKGIIGSANKIRLTLNGIELTPLGRGDVQQISLKLAQNTLSAVCDGVTEKSIVFDAPESGVIRIDLLFKAGQGIVLEENPDTNYKVTEPGKKRVRPLKIGMVLWSISNFWCYFLGIVPLRKALRAAKHPFDDVAEVELKGAKKWNIFMSILLVLVVGFVYIIRQRYS